VTIRAISSKWSSSNWRNLNIARARMTGGVSLHSGNAFVAAATAASRSEPVESGVFAITIPRAGLWTSTNSAALDGIQRPPTKLLRMLMSRHSTEL
jgi:hypothetical protein